MQLVVLLPLLILFSLSSLISCQQFPTDGTVLELNDSNFNAAISTFEYIFVDFYAPWCKFSKLLDPELEKAAPVLAGLTNPIMIARLNVDKYNRLAYRYKIDGFPTLKMFIHGVPTDYYGKRNADILVESLKKLVANDDDTLSSDHNVI